MNNYILELKDKEGNVKEIKLRLKSADCIEIEKKTNMKMLDLIRDYSMTTVIMLLKYLRRSELPQFSDKDACELYDEIIDNGYNLQTILTDVIYEGLIASGFLTRGELEEIKKLMEEPVQIAPEAKK